MNKKLLIASIITVLALASTLAWTPPGNIDLRNCYNLTNAYFVDVYGTIRSTEYRAPESGTGLELGYSTTNGRSQIISYDRTGSAYKQLYHNALDYVFKVSGTEALVLNDSGLILESGYYYGNGSQLTGVIAEDATTLDGYDSTYFYPLNLTMSNATLFKDNDKAYFGTDYDVAMYFNGTHFIIES